MAGFAAFVEGSILAALGILLYGLFKGDWMIVFFALVYGGINAAVLISGSRRGWWGDRR